MVAIGTKTTEVTKGAALAQNSEILGNVGGLVTRIGVADIAELAKRRASVPGGQTITLTNEDHYERFLNIDNAAGPVVIQLNDSEDYLIDELDRDGGTVQRGGLFCRFAISSPDNAVSFVSLAGGNIRATGLASQGGAKTLDTVYVGANLAASDEAIVSLYKRSSFWVLECSQGWREDADGDELQISGAQIGKGINFVSVANFQITDNDHQTPIWLQNAAPGTLTFAAELTQGMQTSIINQGSATATFDFTGHTQLGDTNSIGAGEAGTLIVGPLTSGTNHRIVLKASS